MTFTQTASPASFYRSAPVKLIGVGIIFIVACLIFMKALASNAALVELEKARRWNGALPTQMLSGVVPFMQFQAPKP